MPKGKWAHRLPAFVTVFIVTLFASAWAEARPVTIDWYKPYYQGAATVRLPADNQVDTYFSFQGEIGPNYEAVLVKVANGLDEVYYYYPVQQQTVSGTVYLRFGTGTYQVEYNLVRPDDDPSMISFDRLAEVQFQNNNVDDLRYLLPSWGIESDNQDISDMAKDITQGISDPYQQVIAIHDWVSKNIKYDMDKYGQKRFYDNDGALAALKSRQGLCRDYANLVTALCRAVGIEAKTVLGQAGVGKAKYGHAWNEVKAGERWISLDATWDAGYIRQNSFIPSFSRKYFDLPGTEVEQTHQKTTELY